jgi:hypothetical protein
MFGNNETIENGGIYELHEDGTRTVCASGTAYSTSKAFAKLTKVGVDGKEIPQVNYLYKWFEMAKTDELVLRVLLFLSFDSKSWVGLYRIYEVIKSDCLKNNWINKATSDRFTHTANSYKAVGIYARHGSTKHEPPKDPMSLEEAQSIIDDLVKKWLMVRVTDN